MDAYQLKALESVAIKEKDLAALAHRSLGLSGEAGEVASIVKKLIRDKEGVPHDSDLLKLKEKLGDALYYVAVLSEYFGFSLSDVAEMNIEKSKKFKESRAK